MGSPALILSSRTHKPLIFDNHQVGSKHLPWDAHNIENKIFELTVKWTGIQAVKPPYIPLFCSQRPKMGSPAPFLSSGTHKPLIFDNHQVGSKHLPWDAHNIEKPIFTKKNRGTVTHCTKGIYTQVGPPRPYSISVNI